MLVLELKFWTTRNDLKLVGFLQILFYQDLVFFQASFRIETWVSSQLQVSILDDVEARHYYYLDRAKQMNFLRL